MPRARPRDIDPKARMEYLDLLWTSVSELQSRDQVKNFFKDLLSETEAVMLARRILIAHRLLQGKSFHEIAGELSTSFATIGRVNDWLVSGFGGYEKALANFETAVKKRLKKGKEDVNEIAYSFDWLRKKYPLHFLLFNLLSKK
ncbi:MAG: Trp family transcriptional regulator [Patescibacteria group bacterium]